MRNYLVTGGAGFIGSHVVDLLLKLKKRVKVIDNLSTGQLSNLNRSKKNIKFFKVDISKKSKKLSKIFKGIDCVIHCAGLADLVPSIKNPNKYFSSNVIGTLNVLSASRESKVKKFVYAASASCYGIPKKFPISENTQIDTQYPYATTKFIGEKLVLDWAKIYKMNNVSLRFFNIYGPRSRTTGAYGAVFGVFLAHKISNKPLTIVGNGKQTRDFLHVNDLVKAIFLASKKLKSGTILNLGGGKEVSVNKIANLISNKKVYIPKRPGEPDRSLANINLAKKLLNWKPKVSLEKGVKNLLENINQFKKAPVWTPNKIKKETRIWFKYLK